MALAFWAVLHYVMYIVFPCTNDLEDNSWSKCASHFGFTLQAILAWRHPVQHIRKSGAQQSMTTRVSFQNTIVFALDRSCVTQLPKDASRNPTLSAIGPLSLGRPVPSITGLE